jgi:hypothetical protein
LHNPSALAHEANPRQYAAMCLPRLAPCLALCLLVQPVAAAEPMSAAEFEAYTTGRTLFYGQGGQAYGAEEYLDDRRVIWSFLDGECKDGRWYPDGREICFVYDDSPEPQCWQFFRETGGLIAEFMGNPAMSELYEAQDMDEEMVCLGPRIGV